MIILTTSPIPSRWRCGLKTPDCSSCWIFIIPTPGPIPGIKPRPAAWAGLTFAQLVPQMRSYNSNAIAAFAAAGAMPDYVQIGNEITDGMVWTNGQLTGTWSSSNPSWIRLGQLMTNAIQGIRDAANAAGAQMPKIVVHIDRGGDWSTTRSYFDNLNAQGVPYDIIGESYYPFYHGPYTNLANCVTNAAKRYGKPIFIAETDFPYIFSTNIYGIPATTNGQVQFVVTLAQIVKARPIIWAPEFFGGERSINTPMPTRLELEPGRSSAATPICCRRRTRSASWPRRWNQASV